MFIKNKNGVFLTIDVVSGNLCNILQDECISVVSKVSVAPLFQFKSLRPMFFSSD